MSNDQCKITIDYTTLNDCTRLTECFDGTALCNDTDWQLLDALCRSTPPLSPITCKSQPIVDCTDGIVHAVISDLSGSDSSSSGSSNSDSDSWLFART